jgi:hypothetical protein
MMNVPLQPVIKIMNNEVGMTHVLNSGNRYN